MGQNNRADDAEGGAGGEDGEWGLSRGEMGLRGVQALNEFCVRTVFCDVEQNWVRRRSLCPFIIVGSKKSLNNVNISNNIVVMMHFYQ